MCGHNSGLARSFDWFCSSSFLQFLVTIVAPYILLIVWQNAVIPAQMYRSVDFHAMQACQRLQRQPAGLMMVLPSPVGLAAPHPN